MEMTQNGYESVIGIDVSKAKLDVAKGSQGAVETIDNDTHSIKELIATHAAKGLRTLVVVEATGGYETLLVESLQAASMAVAVVNPRRVRDFAKGVGCDAKTDSIDAKVIARYGEVVQPQAARPKTKAEKELAAMVIRRRQLLKMVNMENNRLGQSSSKMVKLIKETLKALKKHGTGNGDRSSLQRDETGTVPVYLFFGLPGLRSVDSRPSCLAVSLTQSSSP